MGEGKGTLSFLGFHFYCQQQTIGAEVEGLSAEAFTPDSGGTFSWH